MDKIEARTANTILEKQFEVDVNGKKYSVSPISVATLIEVSRLIYEMPWIDSRAENIITETLRTARDCGVLGKIVATLILGVKRKKVSLFRFLLAPIENGRFKKLENSVLQLTPNDLSKLIIVLLASMEMADFFGLTTSLSEVNLLRPTKEVG